MNLNSLSYQWWKHNKKLSNYFVILFISHDSIGKFCGPRITQLGVMKTHVTL